ncbi:MAG: helix-turn-helix domain-containing protein [Lentisphaerae bacterium]|nr:helix-turn-helix domain-containing protein [Lentisphaerota bacterium]MCP4103634.1 helix-turn-helix domain-containing protein [Lentisphaerota bacterium]
MENRIYDFTILRELRKRDGMNIADLSEKSGVSASVISKLERNQTVCELETVFRLAKVFGLTASDLIALCEDRTAQTAASKPYTSGDFRFERVVYGNLRAMYGRAKAGAKVHKPELHRNDYEMCWVLKRRLQFYLPKEKYELKAGESIQFDALLEHSYEALEDCEIVLLHLRKDKRF